MRIVHGKETATSALLKRHTPDSVELPLHVRQRIQDVFGEDLSPDSVVAHIIQDIRTEGDAALYKYTEKLDGAKLNHIQVPSEEIADARKNIDRELLSALEAAADRIRAFHEKQRGSIRLGRIEFGNGVGQLLAPLERVGVYAPGGTAAYPSTVLMTVIPARAAGVDEVILATPPRPDGHIPPLTLAAAEIAKADRVVAVGGAPAIAALAFGTESVPKVDKICGPGNVFVMLAKKHVFGIVDIDGLQGPTETVVVADDSANPVLCAADLLAQAEHDEMASAIMITTSSTLAARVNTEIDRQLTEIDRRDIAERSLEQRGGIVVVDSMDEAVDLINAYAPEHLCLLVEDPQPLMAHIRHAGGIFIGESSPEALGDYVAGPSHVMPTEGTARFRSPLNVTDFLKITSVVSLDESSLRETGSHAITIARAEGLTAHAIAVERRMPERQVE